MARKIKLLLLICIIVLGSLVSGCGSIDDKEAAKYHDVMVILAEVQYRDYTKGKLTKHQCMNILDGLYQDGLSTTPAVNDLTKDVAKLEKKYPEDTNKIRKNVIRERLEKIGVAPIPEPCNGKFAEDEIRFYEIEMKQDLIKKLEIYQKEGNDIKTIVEKLDDTIENGYPVNLLDSKISRRLKRTIEIQKKHPEEAKKIREKIYGSKITALSKTQENSVKIPQVEHKPLWDTPLKMAGKPNENAGTTNKTYVDDNTYYVQPYGLNYAEVTMIKGNIIEHYSMNFHQDGFIVLSVKANDEQRTKELQAEVNVKQSYANNPRTAKIARSMGIIK